MKILNQNINDIEQDSLKESILTLNNMNFTVVLAKANMMNITLWKLLNVVTDEFSNSKLITDRSLTVIASYDFTVDKMIAICLGGEIYACKIIEGSLYVSNPLSGEDFEEVIVISDDETMALIDNILKVNQITFNLLHNELSSDKFKGDFPWCTNVSRNGDLITLMLGMQTDSKREHIEYFEIGIKQDYMFDTLRHLVVTIEKSPSFNDMLLTDAEGFIQDIGLTRASIVDIYSYVVTKYLSELGISSQEELTNKLPTLTIE